MAFEFGMFHEFQRTAGMTEEDAFATSFEQIDAAESKSASTILLGRVRSGDLGSSTFTGAFSSVTRS